MKDFKLKIYLGVVAIGFTTLAIQLFPVSRQAHAGIDAYEKLRRHQSQAKGVKKMNDESKEVL